MPPAQWRESLLRMLDALLPTPPASASNRQRARWNACARWIDAFATPPRDAGFDAPVPVEAVRAHFAGVLAETDPARRCSPAG